MSQENVEIVRRVWEAIGEGFDRGDAAAGFDAPFELGLFAPTSTYTPAAEVPGSETYIGRDGFGEFLRAWTADFVDFRMWPEQIIDAGGDRVVAVLRQSARGRGSGAAVELRFASVYTLKGGQVVDRQNYLDPAEALEAVGLSEQDAHTDS
jgi:ketosteroid isomerase-like protein